MKISNTIKGSRILIILVVVICVFIMGAIIGIPAYNQYKIETQFPIGSSIQLKGLDIKGNVSQYGSQGVNILIIDKYGQAQTITVDSKLLSK